MPPKPDVRRLLKKQQLERNKVNKITHPFAKYDEAGRLVCVVCNAPVKSEAVWQAHLGSSVHRDNIQKLKALKQQQQQQQQLKRRAPSPSATEISASDNYKRMRMEEDKQDIELDEDASDEDEDMELPNDFFDNPADQDDIPEEVPEQIEEEGEDANNTLPVGFFDDPEEDARIQGTLAPEEQSQADLEKDIAMFNEAMIEVTKESREVQEEDDEIFWVERHFDISQEQAAFDSRVEKLKQLRQGQDASKIVDQTQETVVDGDDDDSIRAGLKSSVRQILKNKPVKKVESMFDDDEEESDDEEEDWRAQQL